MDAVNFVPALIETDNILATIPAGYFIIPVTGDSSGAAIPVRNISIDISKTDAFIHVVTNCSDKCREEIVHSTPPL